MKYFLHVLGGTPQPCSFHRYQRARSNWKHAETRYEGDSQDATASRCILIELRITGHSALFAETSLSGEQRDTVRDAKTFKRKRRQPDRMRSVGKVGRNARKLHAHQGKLAHMQSGEIKTPAKLTDKERRFLNKT
jgi:hypothetical protein